MFPLQKWVATRRVHRTDNTQALDDRFAPISRGHLFQPEDNEIARFAEHYDWVAGKRGYFVAIPQHHPSMETYLAHLGGEDSLQGFIDAKIDEGLLVPETVTGGVSVISPSYDLANAMYGPDIKDVFVASRRLQIRLIKG